ncbi:putative N-acetyltransferase complex ARD1 subunit [Trypanosoma cruzi]|nr:putative N-acetyltransferase complex ARD1 subunit [Trypanosoma cruzi]
MSGDLRQLILRRVSHALLRVSAPLCVCPTTGICMAYALCKAEGKGGNSHGHMSAVRMRKLWTCLCGKAARSLRGCSIDWECTFWRRVLGDYRGDAPKGTYVGDADALDMRNAMLRDRERGRSGVIPPATDPSTFEELE